MVLNFLTFKSGDHRPLLHGVIVFYHKVMWFYSHEVISFTQVNLNDTGAFDFSCRLILVAAIVVDMDLPYFFQVTLSVLLKLVRLI